MGCQDQAYVKKTIGTHETGKEEVDTILFIPGWRQAVPVQGLRVCCVCVASHDHPGGHPDVLYSNFG